MANIIQYVFLLQAPSITFSVTIILGLLLVFAVRKFQKKSTQTSSPPVVPGLPFIGNLHQLSEKKPHQTFTRWSEIYGPIYSIKTGASTLVVLNTTEVAKEAMVTRFSSISTRVLSNALTILTSDKCMVATSDYNEFYKTVKRNLHSGFLGANAQKRFRVHRDAMINNMVQKLHTYTKSNPFQAINVRSVIVKELFGLALKQSLGKDLESSIHVEELGAKLSKDEIFEILVGETTGAATDVDWRDFFPYLRWVPNKRMELRMQRLDVRRKAVMKALTKEQKKRITSGEVLDSFVDFLSSKECEFTEDQVNMLIWEPIVETSDTTLATTEWAIYELANNKRCQGLLYHEIQSICGSTKITEEHLPQLKYLNAVIHETLRKHSPISILPPRYVHEDTQLGGYHIRAGTEIVINIYGCNMDKKQWKDPEKWRPERFLESKYDPTDLFKTMAFGGGKRLCLGAQQAMAISSMTIGTFVQEFQWSLEEGEKDDVSTLCLTTHKLHPLQAIITPREYIGCP